MLITVGVSKKLGKDKRCSEKIDKVKTISEASNTVISESSNLQSAATYYADVAFTPNDMAQRKVLDLTRW